MTTPEDPSVSVDGATGPKTRPEVHRATGASLAAILLVLVSLGAVGTLHVLRADLDPVSRVMSEYANGPTGLFMTAAFYAMGLALLALAFRVRRAIDRRGATKLIPALLALAGAGFIVSGVFEVERPLVPDTAEELIHSYASLTAFVELIVAMLLFSLATRHDPRWWGFRHQSTGLAVFATVAAAASPVADRTPWTGVAQRLLGLSVLLWLLLTALRIRAQRPEDDLAAGSADAAGGRSTR